jgi:hypothetical protein
MDRLRIIRIIKTVCKLTGSLVGVNRHEDIAVLRRLDRILDEARLAKILNYSLYTERLCSEEREVLHRFTDALRDNQYLHPVIALRARQLTSELSQLLDTVGATFSSNGGATFHFRRDPKDHPAYDRGLDDLHKGIERTWKAYKVYRQVANDRLNVF